MKTYRIIAILLLAFNSLSALFGGAILIADPFGNLLQMPVSMLGNSPFTDFEVPGIILFTVLGIGSLIALLKLLFNTRYHINTMRLVGWASIIWIVTQMLMLQSVVLLQVIYLFVGILIVISSYMIAKVEKK